MPYEIEVMKCRGKQIETFTVYYYLDGHRLSLYAGTSEEDCIDYIFKQKDCDNANDISRINSTCLLHQ